MIEKKQHPESSVVVLLEQKQAHTVDRHVGAAIRLRRRFLNLSQEHLARQLGLTFQQIQKYERGSNRVSASKLHKIAEVLKVPVAYFFEGIPGAEGASEETDEQKRVRDFLNSRDAVELTDLWTQVSPKARRAVLSVLRAMTDQADDPA